MEHIKGENRDQIRMISLGEMIESESMVRIIDAFVEMLNGIAVASWRNRPNHPDYNDLIKRKLDKFHKKTNPNATPDEAYTFVSELISDIRASVINNPSSLLNDLVL